MIKCHIQSVLLLLSSLACASGYSTIELGQYIDSASEEYPTAQLLQAKYLSGDSNTMTLIEVYESLDLLLEFIPPQTVMDAVLAKRTLGYQELDGTQVLNHLDVLFQAEILEKLLHKDARITQSRHLHLKTINIIKDLIVEKEGMDRFIEIVLGCDKSTISTCVKESSDVTYCSPNPDFMMDKIAHIWIEDALKEFPNLSSKIDINELYEYLKYPEIIKLLRHHNMIACNSIDADEIRESGLFEIFKNPQLIIDQKYKNLSAKTSTEAKIPYIIHHIWLTHPSSPREIRPQDLAIVIANKRTYELSPVKWCHIVWTNDKNLIPSSVKALEAEGIEVRSIHDYKNELRLFEIIVDLIDQHKWGMASDALRYSLVHLFGGIYADLNYTFARDFTREAYTYNFMGMSWESYGILPFMFLGSAQHPVLDQALKLIENNFKNPPSYIETLSQKYFGTELLVQSTLYTVTNTIHLAYLKHANTNGNIDVVYPKRKDFYLYDEDTDSSEHNEESEEATVSLHTSLLKKHCQDLWTIFTAYNHIDSNEICGIDKDYEGDDSSDHSTWLNY